MSEQLTEGRTRPWDGLRAPVLWVLTVLVSYAVVGAAAGWLWHALWNPSVGEVFQHQWYPSEAGLRGDFSGTGLYVLVAVGAGLLLGLVFAVLGGRRPVLTLVAVVAASALAAWLMVLVGEGLSPAEDPDVAAKTAEDGDKLPSTLRISSVSPLLALPMGSLAAVALVYVMFSGSSADPGLSKEPRG